MIVRSEAHLVQHNSADVCESDSRGWRQTQGRHLSPPDSSGSCRGAQSGTLLPQDLKNMLYPGLITSHPALNYS